VDVDNALADTVAAMEFAARETGKKVGVIGYCFGGTIAWLAATRHSPTAAIGYYGGRIANYAEERLSAPVLLHFGKQDAHIPAEEVEKIHAAHPEVQIYLYDAGHGFNCDARGSYSQASSAEARERSLAFLKEHLG
jgi:carboxymethylenebutenolidase